MRYKLRSRCASARANWMGDADFGERSTPRVQFLLGGSAAGCRAEAKIGEHSALEV